MPDSELCIISTLRGLNKILPTFGTTLWSSPCAILSLWSCIDPLTLGSLESNSDSSCAVLLIGAVWLDNDDESLNRDAVYNEMLHPSCYVENVENLWTNVFQVIYLGWVFWIIIYWNTNRILFFWSNRMLSIRFLNSHQTFPNPETDLSLRQTNQASHWTWIEKTFGLSDVPCPISYHNMSTFPNPNRFKPVDIRIDLNLLFRMCIPNYLHIHIY